MTLIMIIFIKLLESLPMWNVIHGHLRLPCFLEDLFNCRSTKTRYIYSIIIVKFRISALNRLSSDFDFVAFFSQFPWNASSVLQSGIYNRIQSVPGGFTTKYIALWRSDRWLIETEMSDSSRFIIVFLLHWYSIKTQRHNLRYLFPSHCLFDQLRILDMVQTSASVDPSSEGKQISFPLQLAWHWHNFQLQSTSTLKQSSSMLYSSWV